MVISHPRHTEFNMYIYIYGKSLYIYICSRKKVFVKGSRSKRKKLSFLFISFP